MKRRAPPSEQRGVALWMLLILVAMAGGYAFYRSANSQFNKAGQETKVAAALVRAKEALIARAVTDDNRPGSLPCPDIGDSGMNVPYDGNADKFVGAGATQCPSYVGWLPWVTLDLPELTDDTGSRLWYVLSPALRDDDSAQPINSDTDPGLTVGGNANNDIAALIIAPRGALAGQDRSPPAGKTHPSLNPAAYLDGENGNGDNIYVTGPQSDNFNDIVMVVTRQELMAAVEKRVANEIRSCLVQHAASTANTDHRYPWPAPFSATNQQGRAGSYFGRVPITQPGSGPKPMLQQNIVNLRNANTALRSASDSGQQLSAVQSLSESLTFSRNLFDAIYIAATKLWQASQLNSTNLTSLSAELAKDLQPNKTGNVSIINSEQNRIRSQANTVFLLIEELPKALSESGIDAFPNELKARTTAFGLRSDLANASAIAELLSRTTASHVDIGPRLNTALAASLNAIGTIQAAAAAPTDGNLAATATAATHMLLSASDSLQNTIQNSRVNIHFSEIEPFVSQLKNLKIALNSEPLANNSGALTAKLNEAKLLITHIATGTSTIVAARDASLQALTNALVVAAAASDFQQIDATTAVTINRIKDLASTMSSNEDNLTKSSLAAATSDFIASQAAFASMNIASTSSRVPYAEALQFATVNVDFWTKIIATEAYDLALRAKAQPVSSDISAYQAADNALNASQTAARTLQTYLDTPTQLKQTAAANALSILLSKLDTLLVQAGAIDATLENSSASAFPIVWLSSRCDFLHPTPNPWWNHNQWASTVFYQISSATMNEPGKLTVSGAGTYRVVTLAAGRAFAGQNRGTQSVTNFFEGINGDPTRNGDATAPSAAFSTTAPPPPPTINFNDRLSY